MAGTKKPHSSYSRSAPASRNGSINAGNNNNSTGSTGSAGKKEEFIPAPLVPALLAPVPPPPAKRKSTDIETGEVGEVLEDAPDKTLMEMLQTYLKKQDPYTRILMVVVLLLLAGGALGAYVLILWYAIDKQNPRYIVLVSVISLILFWVLWKVSRDREQTRSPGRFRSSFWRHLISGLSPHIFRRVFFIEPDFFVHTCSLAFRHTRTSITHVPRKKGVEQI